MKTQSIFRKTVLVLCCFFCLLMPKLQAQEIGYNIGLSQLGIQSNSIQPLYGFSMGYQLNSNFALESNFFYSQRMYGSKVQADYFSLMLMPKLGFFKSKWGVFVASSILLNPTLDHSNNQNHTYLSSYQAIGAQLNLRPELLVDVKLGYDLGLTGGFYDYGNYQKYWGPMLLLGMKMKVSRCVSN